MSRRVEMRLARLALGPAFVLALTSLVGCETAKPAMTLEEARAITASFTGASFAPPPRTITDIKKLLEPEPFMAGSREKIMSDFSTRTTTFAASARRLADEAPPSENFLGRSITRRWLLRGLAARKIGRFTQAREDLRHASEYLDLGFDIDLRVEILKALAETEAASGNYWRAIVYYEKAIADAAKVGQPGWQAAEVDIGGYQFEPLAQLAALHAATGDLKAADAVLSKLLALRRSMTARPTEAVAMVPGPFGSRRPGDPCEGCPPGTLRQGANFSHAARFARYEWAVSSAQATVFELRGQSTEAERLWRSAIAALGPIQGALDNDTNVAHLDATTSRLAVCLLRQGRLVEAEVEARKAVVSIGSRSDITSFDNASLVLVLARVLREQGRYEEASAIATAALAFYEQGDVSPESSLPIALAGRELAAAFAAAERWQAAVTQFETLRARLNDEALYQRVIASDPALISALIKTRRIDEAAALVAPALDVSRRIRGEKHQSTAELRGLGAIALAMRGDVSAARMEFAEAASVLLNYAEYVDDESASRGEQEQRRTWILAEYIGLLSRMRGPGATPAERDAVAEAFRVADGARGGSVQRALGAAIARSAAATPALGDLARREQDAAKQIAALQGLLAATIGDGAKDAETDLRRRIETLQRARQALVQEIEQKFPAYTELINPRPATIERARAALHPGEALLATYVGEERTYVWAVPKTGPVAFAVVPLGASAIGASVATLRKALDSGARTLQDIPAFDVGGAHELYRQILEPVKAGWESASSLIVVAHGPLTQIPWTLLPTRAVPLGPERAPLFSNYRAIPWLVRTHTVTVVPSVATLAALRALPAGDPQRRPFVGFGDPYFSVAHARQGSAERMAALSARGGLTLRDVAVSPGADVQESRLAMLPRLPDTADEIRAIARVLGADEARDVFLGVAANERNVKTLELSRYRVIAFATHGLVPGDIDGLTQPALALTAPEIAKVEGDGLLTMEKILALRLNADWVVLSACNTANGAGAGAEAISGLGRAFFYAGARALLVTLWPVETTSATAMTTEIFRRQASDATLTRAKALQQTTNTMIDDGGMIDPSTGRMTFSYAHPLFWAPFVLVGDGG
jgi:CHAT domain-containing protein